MDREAAPRQEAIPIPTIVKYKSVGAPAIVRSIHVPGDVREYMDLVDGKAKWILFEPEERPALALPISRIVEMSAG